MRDQKRGIKTKAGRDARKARSTRKKSEASKPAAKKESSSNKRRTQTGRGKAVSDVQARQKGMKKSNGSRSRRSGLTRK